MPASIIDIKNFTIIPGTGLGHFMHKIRKGLLTGDPRVFYQKEMESGAVASLEVLAQEFFRLIAPLQPETRIACHPNLNTYFVLSEEIIGYKPLPTNSPKKFTQGSYPGLGQIMIISIFLQEIDLKNGNICLNNNNQVVKIDGDWCFAAIRSASFSDYKKNITPELLSTLPFPFGYSAFNWLDISSKGIAKQSSSMLDEDLANAPHFRNEINEAILKILLLTDDYITKFVDAYVPVSTKADLFINYLKNRREELKLAALRDESFKLYLKSELAKQNLSQHLLHLKSFVANGDYPIFDVSGNASFNDEFMSIYEELCASEIPNTNQITAFELINQINVDFSSKTTKKSMLDYRDLLLKQINNCIESFSNSADNKQIDRKRLMQLVEEKRKLVQNISSQLEQRFNVLEQLGFDTHIKLFTKKRIEMSVKVSDNANYIAAEKKARVFCSALDQIRSNFISLDKSFEQAKKDLKKESLLAVKDARTILDNHREWHGKIKKFIIDILSFLTIGLSTRLGIFGKTDSGVKLDNLEQVVSKTIN